MTINSITKKDGETLNIGDATNKGKIKFFREFMGEIYAVFEEHPIPYKLDDVSKKGVGDGFVWTDELVEEYAHNCHYNINGFDMYNQKESQRKFKQFKSTKRKPLFRTEDGVDVFEGDDYWWLHKSTLTHDKISNADRYSGKEAGFIYFSTKEAAEAYVAKQSQPTKEESKREWEIIRYGYAQQQNDGPDIQYIHSVRRLSDGEVFSVGDEYINSLGYEDTIRSFGIEKNEIHIFSDQAGYCRIEEIKKLPPKPQENKERIEVVFHEVVDMSRNVYGFTTTIPIKHSDKIPQIKKAIEAVLNDNCDDSKSKWFSESPR